MNWFADTDAIAKVSAFRQSVEASFLPLTEDNVITSAFNKKTHQWIEDVSADNNREAGCLRADCVSAGFKSVITVPVLFEGAALAVLEFRTFEARSENLDVVSSASSVATRSISAAMESDLSESISTTTSTRSTYTDQMNSVYRLIMQEGQFAEAVVAREIEWFYSRLCFNDFYFQHYPPDVIARHVLAFIAAKVHAQATGQEADVEFTSAEKDHAIYICPAERAVAIQRKIEEKYIGEGFLGSPGIVAKGQGLSAKMFLSAGTAGPNSSVRLTLHVVGAQSYVNPESSSNETDIWKVASGVFLREKSFSSRDRYAKILKRAVASLGPVFDASASTTPGEDAVLTCAYRAGSTHSFYSSLSLLLTQRKVTITRGYVETFANGINCISLHLKDVKLEAMPDIVESASLLWILPRTTLSDLFVQGKLTLQESVYAYAAWKFAFHFTSAKTEEFNTLYAALKDNPVASANLLRLKKRIRSDVTTEARCAETIMENVDLIKELYQNFKKHHQPAAAGQPQPEKPTFCNELWNKISKNVMSNVDQAVLRTILVFNSCILRTNFFYSSKTALSFRIDPSFLADDVPQVPFAMFLLIGAEFRGFHIRFDDVARGGIRLIRSRNKQIWQRNAETVFDENYNLAWTQQKKNKDIPEGGSKGTVLVNVDHQNRAIIAFHKYIDSLLDCILVKPGEMVDHYGKQELIFCGPDEGTADLMDWAALHAKSRGYASWAAFTTGKSVELGGIPHDTYGMTTRGVHQYVLGIMRKLNIQEDTVTKFQTGGPDGDLGSNEIKISKDNTIGIVDGSGVLYDPKGLNRTELRRLANARKMSEHFDRKLLSPEGFFVHIDDKDITLPNGTLVESGMNFRNGFHTNPLAKAEFFVPCGGRPEAINISNVNQCVKLRSYKNLTHLNKVS
jgi:glutamate dehydrogenase